VVIKLGVSNYEINKVLIDNRSYIDVIFYDYFIKHGIKYKDMSLLLYSITGFTELNMFPKGKIKLPVKVVT